MTLEWAKSAESSVRDEHRETLVFVKRARGGPPARQMSRLRDDLAESSRK
jgi:hypothetical protein